MLMIGSLLHGVGNWQDIKNDDSLGLYFDLFSAILKRELN